VNAGALNPAISLLGKKRRKVNTLVSGAQFWGHLRNYRFLEIGKRENLKSFLPNSPLILMD